MQKKQGVILVNLGTPSAATPAAVRSFLRDFLSDRRVVDLPRILWLPLLYGVILPLRSRRVARNYQSIWQAGGSPLLTYSDALARDVEAGLLAQNIDCPVRLAMTYGEPSLEQAWQQLASAGVTEVLLLPLYPQYSSTTTAPVFDAWARLMSKQAVLPAMQLLADYHDAPEYIAALAGQVRRHWQQQGQSHLLLSFHGIPQRYARLGDPYPQQCARTAQLVAQALQLSSEQWSLSFQSRFGREPWLQPYTDELLTQLPARGVMDVDVVCPGFATDCLETLEEIAIGGKELFLHAGGRQFHYIPALNAGPEHGQMLIQFITQRFAY
ncbi:ferrochelatase [Pseudaeromonas sharmana]|uniref:Ferrochelatase n=1 Tax=Pseudaeromonas sharmana TaxID=328412 RepID=A0ABV8CNY6_9GAMM